MRLLPQLDRHVLAPLRLAARAAALALAAAPAVGRRLALRARPLAPRLVLWQHAALAPRVGVPGGDGALAQVGVALARGDPARAREGAAAALALAPLVAVLALGATGAVWLAEVDGLDAHARVVAGVAGPHMPAPRTLSLDALSWLDGQAELQGTPPRAVGRLVLHDAPRLDEQLARRLEGATLLLTSPAEDAAGGREEVARDFLLLRERILCALPPVASECILSPLKAKDRLFGGTPIAGAFELHQLLFRRREMADLVGLLQKPAGVDEGGREVGGERPGGARLLDAMLEAIVREAAPAEE
mmetsp:Transcript_24986/g.61896  ORF Transcript_24986/g.61896 Transcript_24986/m.61896 type:complete len:302 (-) Transcript_24986:70-975(-)